MYSKLQDNELLERYENIDTYFEEAKEAMTEELIKRNLKTREEIVEKLKVMEEESKKRRIEQKAKLKKLTIALVIFAVIISSPFMLIKFSRWQKIRGMEKYLEEKYGQDFVVENLKSQWNTGYMTVILSADAHLKSNKEVDFTVIKEPKLYRDTYLPYLWEWQAKQKIEKVVEEIYGKGNYYIRNVDADIRKRGWKVNNLSYDDIIRQYSDIAEVTVWMASFTDRFDEKVEAEKALKLYQKIWVKNQIEYFDLIVEIVKNNKKKEYMDFIKSRKVYFVEELYNEGLVKERINILHWYDSDKEEPKDVNDIIKNRYYFKNGGLYR